MMDDKIKIEIDINEDFDVIDLEIAIVQAEGKAKEILVLIHHKWANYIEKPEYSKLN